MKDDFCFWQKHDKRQKEKTESICQNCWEMFSHTKSRARQFCTPACQDEMIGGPIEVRLGRLIDKGDFDSCWLWRGTRNAGGYGQLSVEGKTMLAHRMAYRTFVGPIPPGHLILHACDNPRCCNYWNHLRTGTHDENMRDVAERNRGAKSKTTWAQRVQLVREMRAGGDAETVGGKYGITAASVVSWVKKFADGRVFGYDQFLDEE